MKKKKSLNKFSNNNSEQKKIISNNNSNSAESPQPLDGQVSKKSIQKKIDKNPFAS